MDFTEAVEYKFLCPSFLTSLRDNRQETKVDGWGQRHVEAAPAPQQTSSHLSSSHLLCRERESKQCPNSTGHHRHVQGCCRAHQNYKGSEIRSSLKFDNGVDNFLTPPGVVATRDMLHTIHHMLSSSPKFEPTFHLEDIDVVEQDNMGMAGLLLEIAGLQVPAPDLNTLLAPDMKNRAWKPNTTHSLRGVMSTGNLDLLHFPNHQLNRFGSRPGRPSTSLGPQVFEDVPTVEFDRKNATMCGETSLNASVSPLFQPQTNKDGRHRLSSLTLGLSSQTSSEGMRKLSRGFQKRLDLCSEVLAWTHQCSSMDNLVMNNLIHSNINIGFEGQSIEVHQAPLTGESDEQFELFRIPFSTPQSSRAVSRASSNSRPPSRRPSNSRPPLSRRSTGSPDASRPESRPESIPLHPPTQLEIGNSQIDQFNKKEIDPSNQLNQLKIVKQLEIDNEKINQFKSQVHDHPSNQLHQSDAVHNSDQSHQVDELDIRLAKPTIAQFDPSDPNQLDLQESRWQYCRQDSPVDNTLSTFNDMTLGNRYQPDRYQRDFDDRPRDQKEKEKERERERDQRGRGSGRRSDFGDSTERPETIRSIESRDLSHLSLSKWDTPGRDSVGTYREKWDREKWDREKWDREKWDRDGRDRDNSGSKTLTDVVACKALHKNSSMRQSGSEAQSVSSKLSNKSKTGRFTFARPFEMTNEKRNEKTNESGSSSRISTTGSIMNRMNRESGWIGLQNQIKEKAFVILSAKAATELTSSLNLQSRNLEEVFAQLRQLVTSRSDARVIHMSDKSRVFELLARAATLDIFERGKPSLGNLYFESFFSGRHIETDTLVSALSPSCLCLVLLRKASGRKSRKRVSSTGDQLNARPALHWFNFGENVVNTTVTYQCSVAVTSVDGVNIPPSKLTFHSCQVVIDGRRLYHTFLQATSSSSDDLSFNPSDFMNAYACAKSHRIPFFSTETAPAPSNSTPDPPNSTPDPAETTDLDASSKLERGLISLSSDTFPGLSLADLFVPALLPLSSIATVKLHPTIARQLLMTFSIPRPPESVARYLQPSTEGPVDISFQKSSRMTPTNQVIVVVAYVTETSYLCSEMAARLRFLLEKSTAFLGSM